MPDIVSVRKADLSNKADFERLYRATRLAAMASHVSPPTREGLQQDLDNGDYESYIILDGPRILGAALSDTDTPYLRDFAIYKRHQGKGYGKPALEAVLKQIAQKDKPFQLDVGYDNWKAQHLYEQAGFEKEHEWKSTGNWHMKKDAASITFPEEEIPTISKQDRIITTRVSDDYNKYKSGDVVEAPWGASYTVNSRINLDRLEEHPYYNELTDAQKELLSRYKRIAVLELLKNKFHRVEYGNTGVYQALKEKLTPEEWKNFLADASWLPKPSVNYTDAYRSFFTDEGYKEFL